MIKEKEKNNKLEIFKNKEFGEIQIIEINGKFEFEATGMAKILGYANTVDAIQRHCKKRWGRETRGRGTNRI